MTKQTAILDLLDTTRGPETQGANVERFAIPVLQVIGTTEDIRAGTILIHSAARLPQSVHFASKQYGPWKLLTTMDGFAVERTLSELGWHFFFMVQEINAAGVSFTPRSAMTKALKKLTAVVEFQSLNALEIVKISRQSFLWLYYASAAAYPRDAGPSPFVRDLDRYHAARNVWDFKQVFRRRAQIGRTSKGI
jgi:hypothetical protein